MKECAGKNKITLSDEVALVTINDKLDDLYSEVRENFEATSQFVIHGIIDEHV
jgi:hypothetical protein